MHDVERMTKAALLRFCQNKTWEQVAEELDVDPATLWRWRQTDEWREAMGQAVEDMKRDGLGIAWQRLLTTCTADGGAPGVTAAKEILARTEGAVSQTLGLHGVDGKPPVAFALTDLLGNPTATEKACELEEALATSGVADPGGSGAGTE